MPQVDELTLVVKSDVSQALAGLQAVDAKAGRTGGGLRKLGGMAAKGTVALGVAAVAAGGYAASLAMGFETSMAQIEANVGTTGADLEKLSDAALSMGAKFGVSADEAAAGLFFLQSAGLSVDDSISALETSAKMSAMGLGEMEDIANGLTTAMTNFGISSDEAGDLVAKAVELGKSSPEEMTKILNQNAAAAAAVGIEFDTLSASSAFLTRITGDANKAGTQMQGMLAKLIKPSQMGKKALEEIGLTTADVAEMFNKDPFAAMQDVDALFADAGVSSNEWAGMVFEDVNAINGALSLLNASEADQAAMMDGVADAAGKVDAGFAVIADTSGQKLKQLMEGLKSAIIPIGAVILDVVVPALQWLGEWVGKGIEWFKEFIGGGEELGGKFSEIWGNLKAGIATLTEWWDEHWLEIKGAFMAVWTVVENIISDVIEWAGPFIEEFTAKMGELFGELVDWFVENWPAIQETILIVLSAIQTAWDLVWPHIQAVIENVFKVIFGVIEGVMHAIMGVIEIVMGIIRGDWSQVWEGIKKVVTGVWEVIESVVIGAWDNLWLVIGPGLELLGEVWNTIWTTAEELVVGIWEGIQSGFKTMANAVIGFFENMTNKIIDGMNKVIGAWNNANLFLNFADIDKIGHVSFARLGHGGTGGGSFEVGDRGLPERINLPAGSTVTPLPAGGETNDGIVINLNAPQNDPLGIAREVGWELTKRGF